MPFVGLLMMYFYSPDSWGATFFLFEYAIEIGTGGEATFGRNDVVVVVGIVEHHLLCRLETYLGKPDTEGGVKARSEVA